MKRENKFEEDKEQSEEEKLPNLIQAAFAYPLEELELYLEGHLW